MRKKMLDTPYERYSVNEAGEVMDEEKGRVLRQTFATQKGVKTYAKVSLVSRVDGSRKLLSVHRLLALAFIPNPEGKRDVNHKDLNKANNALENLEWMTHRENILHGMENVFGWKERLAAMARARRRPVKAIREDGTEEFYESAGHAARALGHVNKTGNIWNAIDCGFHWYGRDWEYVTKKHLPKTYAAVPLPVT